MKRKVIIIGGGVAGLTAAIEAQKNGFDAILYEKHFMLGGLCTAWERKGLMIDGCIHWLTGVDPKSYLYHHWQNLHAFSPDEVVINDSFGTFTYNGTQLTLWSDIERTKNEFIRLSPVDAKQIDWFCRTVQTIGSMRLSINEPMSLKSFPTLLKEGVELFPALPSFIHASKMTCEDLAKRFKHPAIKWVMTHAQAGAGNAFSFMFSYGSHVVRDAGLLKGGSLTLIRNMTNHFLDIGGEVYVNCGVKKIIIENRVARGVVLENGNEEDADYVIAACDPHVTFNKLLNKEYKIKSFAKLIEKKTLQYPTVACCQVTLSLPTELASKLSNPQILHVKPFDVAGKTYEHINIHFYNFDEITFSRNGRITATILLDQTDNDYAFWTNLKKEGSREYKEYKKELGDIVIQRILDVWPNFSNRIEIIDFATPLTYTRYTGAYNGAYMPFRFTTKGGMYNNSGRVKGLKRFIVASQWMQIPGGLPLALASGHYAIQYMCHDLKIKYNISPNTPSVMKPKLLEG